VLTLSIAITSFACLVGVPGGSVQERPTIAQTSHGGRHIDAVHPHAANPVTCAGYRQRRVFLESQVWWQRTPGRQGTNFGHVHTGVCFPYLRKIHGRVAFDVVTKLHRNPGVFKDIIFQARNERYSPRPRQLRRRIVVGKRCPRKSRNDCTFITRVVVNTRVLPTDGLWQFRIRSRVREPDGHIAMPSNAFPTFVRNRKSRVDGAAWTQGRGWYGKRFGYNNAFLLSAIPRRPVTGLWRPKIRTTRTRGRVGGAITRTVVTIDPNFHAVPPNTGVVLSDRPSRVERATPIDTRLLSNGKHKLVIVAQTRNVGRSGSTLSGVLVIPFRVRN
jgi:hypothetical protein